MKKPSSELGFEVDNNKSCYMDFNLHESELMLTGDVFLHQPSRESTRPPEGVTVLNSQDHLLNKKFYLDEAGHVSTVQYQSAFKFRHQVVPCRNLCDLANLIDQISADPRQMLIRGSPGLHTQPVTTRREETFPEHPEGSFWVMLDFDDQPVPDGIDPLSEAAIASIVTKLPSEFHNVSCFYQFSASAGILGNDGHPRKSGLNAHVFFWFTRRVPGAVLAGYLRKHCLETGFFMVGANKGDVCQVKYGIDPAPIRSAVQPHFIAAPEIGPGVQSLLAGRERQGMIRGSSHSVEIPELDAGIIREADQLHYRIRDQWQRDHGYQKRTLITRTSDGIGLVSYSVPQGPTEVRAGRKFVGGQLRGSNGEVFVLSFEDENTPHSWYVTKKSPEIARRYGDGEAIALKELSPQAHIHVRDELKWFTEIQQERLALNERGFLPPLSEFANARVSVVLSPTGSGKTKAMIDLIQQVGGLTIYCAPTITLVNQMADDLTKARIDNQKYDTVGPEHALTSGVVVTTNKSLGRILEIYTERGKPFSIVLDEVHETFDEMLKNKGSLQVLENAIGKARRSFLLTGTMTGVQRKTVATIVSHSLGGLQAGDCAFYEFSPVKTNPIELHSMDCFGSDFMKLLGELKTKLDFGTPLPQVVMVLPTSRMERFRILLKANGLDAVSSVVSRQESQVGEIAEAQECSMPIIIASPLFALGLNFRAEPDIFWCHFDRIPADTSRIIQTINRANRGSKNCDVRLYVGSLDDKEFKIPTEKRVKTDVLNSFSEESTIAGILEEHFTIDRATYQILRVSERQTSCALAELFSTDGFQNYRVVDCRENGVVDKGLNDQFIEASKSARETYDSAIECHAVKFNGCPRDSAFASLEKLALERRTIKAEAKTRTEKEIKDQEIGILMSVCGVRDAKSGRELNSKRLSVLFCESLPYATEQYDSETHPGRTKVEAEKSAAVAYFVEVLLQLQRGELNGLSLAVKLTKDKKFQDGIVALATSERDYLGLKTKIKTIQEARARARSCGTNKTRGKAEGLALGFLQDFLATIGVGFEEVEDSWPKEWDWNKPLIPAHWNLEEMSRQLQIQAAMLTKLPDNVRALNSKYEPAEVEGQVPEFVPLKICKTCVFYRNGLCVLANAIDWSELGMESAGITVPKCKSFKAIQIKLAA